MPLCTPVPSGHGLFWSTLDSYVDSNFCIQQYTGPMWWADHFRIILPVNYAQVATAKQKEEIKADWDLLHVRIQEQMTKSGLTRFSEKFLVSFCKHLYKEHNNKGSVAKPMAETNSEKEALILSFFQNLRNGEGVGDVLWLVPYSQEWVFWEDANGMTPLHVAVELRQPDLVKMCITKGADVNHKDLQGWTPLHFAAYRGALDICEILIIQGNAAVMSISKDGTLPLHYLVRHTPTEGEQRKFTAVLDLLLKKGAPINAQTKHGETPLHQACLKGSADAVSYLLNHSADANVRNVNQETPLCFAVMSGHKLIVTMLVEHGADCTIGGTHGTALELAKKMDQREIYYLLSGFARAKAPSEPPVSLFNVNTPIISNSPTTSTSPSTPTSTSIPTPPLPNNTTSNSSSNPNCKYPTQNGNGVHRKNTHVGEIGLKYPHSFQLTHFSSFTWCSYCKGFMWGVIKQGYYCTECHYSVHWKCKKDAVLRDSCRVAIEKSSALSPSSSSSAISITPSSSIPSSTASSLAQASSLIPPGTTPPPHGSYSKSAGMLDTESGLPDVASLSITEDGGGGDSQSESEDPITDDSSMMTGASHEDIFELHHIVTPEYMDLLYAQFNSLDRVQRGFLTREEFGNSLGTVINDSGLLDALFMAFDQNRDGKIDIKEYFMGMGILLEGDEDSQLKFAFAMMDRDGDGFLTRGGLTSLTEAMHRSLSKVQLVIDRDADHFTDHVFPKQLTTISLAQYREYVLKHKRFVQSLGLLDEEETTAKTEAVRANPKKKKGRTITLGNENWHMVQHLMLGIRQTVGEATHSMEKELKAKDFEEHDFKLINFAGECFWIFKDYAPMVFKKLRELWNIDPKAYMFSLGPEKILGNLLLGNLSALCEVVSTGRSGSLFFKTNDGKYLLKTVPLHEELLARTLLPAYHSHVSKFPNVLMTKFLGLHTMSRGPSGRQADLRFLVMTNVFDTPLKIHEQYDLKGSTIGRHVDAPFTNGDEEHEAEVALKDLDFKRRINLGPEHKAILLEQLEQDCKFLEQHNICDYSFLVGIHIINHKSPLYNAPIVPPSPKPLSQQRLDKTSIYQKDYGGILSNDGKEVYFLGIIDTLTTWDLRKKSEKTLKSIFHDPMQISAIAPTPYRARFQKYISSIVD